MKHASIIALLILSGAFSGLLFRRYWPEAPFPVVLVLGIVLTAVAYKLLQ